MSSYEDLIKYAKEFSEQLERNRLLQKVQNSFRQLLWFWGSKKKYGGFLFGYKYLVSMEQRQIQVELF